MHIEKGENMEKGKIYDIKVQERDGLCTNKRKIEVDGTILRER